MSSLPLRLTVVVMIAAVSLTGSVASATAAGPTNWPHVGPEPAAPGVRRGVRPGPEQSPGLAPIRSQRPSRASHSGGDLLAHYQAPLVHQNDVFMGFKTGPFSDPDSWQTQTWQEKRFHWENGSLVEKWTYASSWKPEPNGPGNGQSSKHDRLGLGGWEPVFHAVLANDFIYVPSADGTIVKLATGDGSVVSSINPGYAAAANTRNFVAGPLSADCSGNVYFNLIQLNNTDPWGGTSGIDVSDSWLVKVAPDDSAPESELQEPDLGCAHDPAPPPTTPPPTCPGRTSPPNPRQDPAVRRAWASMSPR